MPAHVPGGSVVVGAWGLWLRVVVGWVVVGDVLGGLAAVGVQGGEWWLAVGMAGGLCPLAVRTGAIGVVVVGVPAGGVGRCLGRLWIQGWWVAVWLDVQ